MVVGSNPTRSIKEFKIRFLAEQVFDVSVQNVSLHRITQFGT